MKKKFRAKVMFKRNNCERQKQGKVAFEDVFAMQCEAQVRDLCKRKYNKSSKALPSGGM